MRYIALVCVCVCDEAGYSSDASRDGAREYCADPSFGWASCYRHSPQTPADAFTRGVPLGSTNFDKHPLWLARSVHIGPMVAVGDDDDDGDDGDRGSGAAAAAASSWWWWSSAHVADAMEPWMPTHLQRFAFFHIAGSCDVLGSRHIRLKVCAPLSLQNALCTTLHYELSVAPEGHVDPDTGVQV
jgi:hypothetical protein